MIVENLAGMELREKGKIVEGEGNSFSLFEQETISSLIE